MGEETLRQYLDRIHVGPGDDSTLVVQELFGSTEMVVSRRYLESTPNKHLLDYRIVDFIYPYTVYNGSKTIKLIVDK